jgi:ubiquinone/menaquinone biosynthesis C-methylase UbiE
MLTPKRLTAMNSVARNLEEWDRRHQWTEHGDEWKGQATACGVPYNEWKRVLVASLIDPYAALGATILEVGPGQGRWTEYLAQRAGKMILVDLSPQCLEYCGNRFRELNHIEYCLTDGSNLPADLSNSIDLVWSFDCFVHIRAAEMRRYFREIARVLVPGGKAVIHHANRRHATLWLGFLRAFGKRGRMAYRAISMGTSEWQDGWRANVSAKLVVQMARAEGVLVLDQVSRWGERSAHGVPRFNDRVTILEKKS